MKNSRLYFFWIFLSLVSYLKAQPGNENARRAPANVVWSEEYQEPSNAEIQKIVATEGGGFYALRIKESGMLTNNVIGKPYLEYYDARMKLVRKKEIDMRYKGKDRYLKDVIMVNNRLWLLSYFYNEGHGKTYLFAQEINKSNFNLAKDMVKIAEQGETNRDRSDVFSVTVSRDSGQVLVLNRQPNKKDEQSFSLAVYDGNFNEVWGRDTKLPYARRNFSVEDYQVDNQGNVYLLGIIYTEGSNRLERRGRATYQYNIVAYLKDVVEPQEYKILLKDRFVSDLTFRPSENGDLVCAGFYSEKDAKGAKGSCFFKINPKTGDMTSISTREFDFDFMTANLSDRSKQQAKAATDRDDKEREPELFDYQIDKLIMRSDGGVIMIAEQFYIEERQRFNNMGMNPWMGGRYGWYDPWGWNDPWSWRYGNRFNNQMDYYFHYNDIIVVNIQPDGEIAWSSRIPKRQVSVNDGGKYSSYTMSTVADKLYFAYNENPRNLDPTRRVSVAETTDRSSVVFLAEISRDGSLHRYPLFSNRDKGVITRPKICRQVGRRDMAIYGESGRTYRFGVLSFD
jgi:hypothetical protein